MNEITQLSSEKISVSRAFMLEATAASVLTPAEELSLFTSLDQLKKTLLLTLIGDKNFLKFFSSYRYAILSNVKSIGSMFKLEGLDEGLVNAEAVNLLFDTLDESIKSNNVGRSFKIINEDMTVSVQLLMKLAKLIQTKKDLKSNLQKAINDIESENLSFVTFFNSIKEDIPSVNMDELIVETKSYLTNVKDVARVYQDIKEISAMATLDIAFSEVESTFNKIKEVEEKIVGANLRLVISRANKYARNDSQRMDLIQEGSIGLLTAVYRFDLKKECRFSTFAIPWIKQAITKEFYNSFKNVKLPPRISILLGQIKRFEARYLAENGEPCPLEVVAKELEMTEENVTYYKSLAAGEVSATGFNEDGEENEVFFDAMVLGDSNLMNESEKMIAAYESESVSVELMALIKTKVKPKQFEVLQYYFGFKQLDNGKDGRLSYLDIEAQTGMKQRKIKTLIDMSLKQLYIDKDLRAFKEGIGA